MQGLWFRLMRRWPQEAIWQIGRQWQIYCFRQMGGMLSEEAIGAIDDQCQI